MTRRRRAGSAVRATRRWHAFSLIEVMVVVSILAIIAALAAPTLGPMKHAIELDGVSQQVGAFLGRARAEAMAQRRCVRVTIPGTQPPAVMVAELLNTYDCDDTPATAARANGATPLSAANLWLEIARLRIDRTNIRITFDPAPPETATGAPGSAGTNPELRFRPTGRLFAAPTVANPGDGVVRVSHQLLPAASSFKEILIQRQGSICTQLRGVDLTGGPTWSCP
jgi:prepilin-type N-terminal cleavage/methylation domain-containing protein